MRRFFIVTSVCGHVGRGWGIDKDFAVAADSAKEAAQKARQIPRVKHDMKMAIRNVREVDKKGYDEQILRNREDPFFSCSAKREQKYLCPHLDKYRVSDGKRPGGHKVSRKAYVNNYCYHDVQ